MRQSSRFPFSRTLTSLLGFFAPGTGRRRAGTPLPTTPVPPPPLRPRKWSPLLDGGPLFVDGQPLVRPYLLAYERQVAG